MQQVAIIYDLSICCRFLEKMGKPSKPKVATDKVSPNAAGEADNDLFDDRLLKEGQNNVVDKPEKKKTQMTIKEILDVSAVQ